MKSNLIDPCMSYSTCGIVLAIQDVDWMAVGAVILLIARLLKDIPDAYDSVKERIKLYKESKDKTDG